MNTASNRSSTISLKTYKNWCPQDYHLCRTCVRITELCKGALGKIQNISRNYWRDRPFFSKLFFSQEDLDILSTKYPPDKFPIPVYIYIYSCYICIYVCIENSNVKEKWNPNYLYACSISTTTHREGLLYWNPSNMHFALYA